MPLFEETVNEAEEEEEEVVGRVLRFSDGGGETGAAPLHSWDKLKKKKKKKKRDART